jgi:acyl-coenzyme A thioesterase PaaI-like protein
MYHPKFKALLERGDLLHLPKPSGRKSFVHYDPEGKRIQVEYFWQPVESRMIGIACFEEDAEGPPQSAHGGAIAALLDDCMGTSAWMAGHPSVALQITIRYRKFVRLKEFYDLFAWVEKIEGRKIYVRSELKKDDTVHAEGEGLYLAIDFVEKFSHDVKGPVG